jgi:pepF/M3 family oligoendopeptidase
MTTLETKRETRLPHWDMAAVFPSLRSTEFSQAYDALLAEIDAVVAVADDKDIRKGDVSQVTGDVVATFEDVLGRLNDIGDRVREIQAYLYAFVTTESHNDEAQAKMSEFQMALVGLSKIGTRFVAWVGGLDVEDLIASSQVAKDHAFAVRRAVKEATLQMSEIEEDLASSLSPSSRGAWGRLHGNVTSRVMTDLKRPDGTVERLPMAQVRGMADHPDAAIRKAAWEAQMETWPGVEVPLAAALNSIKGWENEINARRGFPDALESALFNNNVDRTTLEAMQEACVESFGDFRRYLKTKAKLMGKDKLPWYDLGAPVGGEGRHWDWDDCASFIVEQFGTYSDALADLAAKAFLERWIDAEPREGKRDGGFCMGVHRDVSRILVNFTHRSMSVATVAHELGHAYHNTNMAHLKPYQRRTPMALAETASTFCETIVSRAIFAAASEEEKLGILNEDLVRDNMIVVAIHSRFLFEKHVFEMRQKRELSATELNEAMTRFQLECFGDALDPEVTHPYMWCVSPHYYSLAYYNWPYTFGLLFGLGLYKRYESDPDAFRASYDELLASTGSDDAATLCARFGIDIRTPDFWRASLDVIRERIDAFEVLAS